jgi:hypothetical protein
MAQQNPTKLAEKIAKLIENESNPHDTASLFATIEKINHRLDRLEHSSAALPVTPAIPAHSSMDKFVIAEAIVDSLFAHQDKEKACSLEPSGKPCDHCSMCNSRGF